MDCGTHLRLLAIAEFLKDLTDLIINVPNVLIVNMLGTLVLFFFFIRPHLWLMIHRLAKRGLDQYFSNMDLMLVQ